jgi:hypothetical protein
MARVPPGADPFMMALPEHTRTPGPRRRTARRPVNTNANFRAGADAVPGRRRPGAAGRRSATGGRTRIAPLTAPLPRLNRGGTRKNSHPALPCTQSPAAKVIMAGPGTP